MPRPASQVFALGSPLDSAAFSPDPGRHKRPAPSSRGCLAEYGYERFLTWRQYKAAVEDDHNYRPNAGFVEDFTVKVVRVRSGSPYAGAASSSFEARPFGLAPQDEEADFLV